ncbi:MAG: DUF4149 domain-containing protein [Betaproteobacteria bacterium]|nr:DUF4149 domain-containing protein [Betaproteobacteria bacterium]NBY72566.1 DUF4149 domain-containing protein [Betaproteobacteria bacterium]NDD12592.1 DUF4149 domain-containing protein [Betaproteobacteria bacterium]
MGLVVVPMLFMYLPTPQTAGQMAAKLFSAQTYLALGFMVIWLWAAVSAFFRNHLGPHIFHQPLFWCVLASGLCSLVLEFIVAPQILLRENLAFWHLLGSGLYLAQGFGVFWALYEEARRFKR